jgi:nicotinate phosphoribosyltransferase
VSGVRIDSGDLAQLSQKVRSLLPEITIFASGDIDEWEIERFKNVGASIDGYGLGTKLVTGAPVNGVYKLVEIDGIPTMKQSSKKATYPGRKQVFRRQESDRIVSDRIGLAEEDCDRNEQPLLELMMEKGKLVKEPETLETIRKRTQASVKSLPSETRRLDNPIPIQINISDRLEDLRSSWLANSVSQK